MILVPEINISRTTTLEFQDFSGVFQDLCLFPGLSRPGNLNILIRGLSRVCTNPVMEHFKTDHHISSAYHPQTNGQWERDNRTLKESLSKLVNDQGNNWDQYIPGVLFAYHTSVHASTKCIPCMDRRPSFLWT